MWTVNLLFNCLIFFLFINLGYWLEKRKKPEIEAPGFKKAFILPVFLGAILTLLDTLRLAFFLQVVIFLAAALFLYWLFSVFTRR